MITADDAVLKAQLVLDEGVRNYLYDDATGQPLKKGDTLAGALTGGIGFNFSANPIPTDVIDLLYVRKIASILARLESEMPWIVSLEPAMQRVLCNVAYNAGVNGLLGFHRFLAACRRGDRETAAAELMDSHLAPARKQRLAQMVRTG